MEIHSHNEQNRKLPMKNTLGKMVEVAFRLVLTASAAFLMVSLLVPQGFAGSKQTAAMERGYYTQENNGYNTQNKCCQSGANVITERRQVCNGCPNFVGQSTRRLNDGGCKYGPIEPGVQAVVPQGWWCYYWNGQEIKVGRPGETIYTNEATFYNQSSVPMPGN